MLDTTKAKAEPSMLQPIFLNSQELAEKFGGVMRAEFFILAIILLFQSVTALAEPIYRWKDKDGITHFGSNPPAETSSSPQRYKVAPINQMKGGSLINQATDQKDTSDSGSEINYYVDSYDRQNTINNEQRMIEFEKEDLRKSGPRKFKAAESIEQRGQRLDSIRSGSDISSNDPAKKSENESRARARTVLDARDRQRQKNNLEPMHGAIISCDSAGCLTNHGERLMRAGPNLIHPTSGRICVITGTSFNCN